MKRLVVELVLVLVVLPAALGWFGEWLETPLGTRVAVAAIGLVAVGIGVEILAHQEASFSGERSSGRAEYYSVIAAELWGLLFAVGGVAMVLGSLASIFMPASWTGLERFLATPRGAGVILVGFGIVTATYGVIRLFTGSAETSRDTLSPLRDIAARGIGIVVVLIGLAMMIFGVLRIFSPQAVET